MLKPWKDLEKASTHVVQKPNYRQSRLNLLQGHLHNIEETYIIVANMEGHGKKYSPKMKLARLSLKIEYAPRSSTEYENKLHPC